MSKLFPVMWVVASASSANGRQHAATTLFVGPYSVARVIEITGTEPGESNVYQWCGLSAPGSGEAPTLAAAQRAATEAALEHHALLMLSLSTLNVDYTQPQFNFGNALAALKSGARVRRRGWNGTGMWLALWHAGTYDAMSELFEHCAPVRQHILDNAASLAADVGSSIVMKTADGSIVFGWLASQTDMLAEDWEIVS